MKLIGVYWCLFLVDLEDITILEREYAISNRLSLPHIISTIMVGVLYLIFPIAVGSYGFLKYGQGTWQLPMRAK